MRMSRLRIGPIGTLGLAAACAPDDDGTGMRTFFVGEVPERPKDNGIRLMIFADNQRIFMGDFVLECTSSLEPATIRRCCRSNTLAKSRTAITSDTAGPR